MSFDRDPRCRSKDGWSHTLRASSVVYDLAWRNSPCAATTRARPVCVRSTAPLLLRECWRSLLASMLALLAAVLSRRTADESVREREIRSVGFSTFCFFTTAVYGEVKICCSLVYPV